MVSSSIQLLLLPLRKGLVVIGPSLGCVSKATIVPCKQRSRQGCKSIHEVVSMACCGKLQASDAATERGETHPQQHASAGQQ